MSNIVDPHQDSHKVSPVRGVCAQVAQSDAGQLHKLWYSDLTDNEHVSFKELMWHCVWENVSLVDVMHPSLISKLLDSYFAAESHPVTHSPEGDLRGYSCSGSVTGVHKTSQHSWCQALQSTLLQYISTVHQLCAAG